MGSSQTKKEIDKKIDEQYKALRKYFDEIYGDITVVQHKRTLHKFIVLEKKVQAVDFEDRLADLSQLDGVLQIKQFYRRHTDMCSQSRVYSIVIEYEENSIEKQIIKRNENQKYFNRDQLLKIMYQMVCIISKLRKVQRQGKLPLHNKLFALTKGYEVKVLDPLLVDHRQENIFEMSISQDSNRKNIFVSPQTMKLFANTQLSQAQQKHSQQKSHVWILGICFLEILLLIDVGQMYNFSQKQIDIQKIKQVILLISRIYGQDIKQIIQGMLQQNYNHRSSLSDVRRSLVQVGGIALDSRKPSVHSPSPSRKQSLSLASKAVGRKSN